MLKRAKAECNPSESCHIETRKRDQSFNQSIFKVNNKSYPGAHNVPHVRNAVANKSEA